MIYLRYTLQIEMLTCLLYTSTAFELLVTLITGFDLLLHYLVVMTKSSWTAGLLQKYFNPLARQFDPNENNKS